MRACCTRARCCKTCASRFNKTTQHRANLRAVTHALDFTIIGNKRATSTGTSSLPSYFLPGICEKLPQPYNQTFARFVLRPGGKNGSCVGCICSCCCTLPSANCKFPTASCSACTHSHAPLLIPSSHSNVFLHCSAHTRPECPDEAGKPNHVGWNFQQCVSAQVYSCAECRESRPLSVGAYGHTVTTRETLEEEHTWRVKHDSSYLWQFEHDPSPPPLTSPEWENPRHAPSEPCYPLHFAWSW